MPNNSRIIISKKDQASVRRNSIGGDKVNNLELKESKRKRRLSDDSNKKREEESKRIALENNKIGQGISDIAPNLPEGGIPANEGGIMADGAQPPDNNTGKYTLPAGADMNQLLNLITDKITGPIHADIRSLTTAVTTTATGMFNVDAKVTANAGTIKEVNEKLNSFVTKDDLTKSLADFVTRQEMQDLMTSNSINGSNAISQGNTEQEDRIYTDSIRASSTKFLITGLKYQNKTEMKNVAKKLIMDTLNAYWVDKSFRKPQIKDTIELKREGNINRVQVEFGGNNAAKDRTAFMRATVKCTDKDIGFSKDLSLYYRDKHWDFHRRLQALKARNPGLEGFIEYQGPIMQLRIRQDKTYQWETEIRYRPPTTDRSFYLKNVQNKGKTSNIAGMQEVLERTISVPLKRVQKETVEENLRNLLAQDDLQGVEITSTKNYTLQLVPSTRERAEELANKIDGKTVNGFTFSAKLFEKSNSRQTSYAAAAAGSQNSQNGMEVN